LLIQTENSPIQAAVAVIW